VRLSFGLSVVALILLSCLALQAAPPAARVAAKSARRPAPAAAVKAPQGAEAAAYQRQVQPLLKKYCGTCHGGAQGTAGLTFSQYPTIAAVLKDRIAWQKVSEAIRSHHMPPKGAPAPADAERALVANWIDGLLTKAECDVRDPGSVTLRRLNRAEYNNTIRDLMGVDLHPADDFPSDDVGYGFDNIGDVLSMSPLLMERYLRAAEKVAAAAIVTDPSAGYPSKRVEAENEQEVKGEGSAGGTKRFLASNGAITAELDFPKEGDYLLRVRAYGQQAGPEPPKMSLKLDGRELALFDVTAQEAAPEVYEKRERVPAGKHPVAVAFTNDFYDAGNTDPNKRDRNLILDYVEVVGPLDAPRNLPASHRRLIPVQPEPGKEREAARKILSVFARRAYRRPVTPDEVERLLKYLDLARRQGDSFETGIQLAVEAVLVSPTFLFRVETNGDPKDPARLRSLNDWELASRLSYFLWSSMPDDLLFSLAARGQLRKPEVLEAQARRMLKDARSHALVENFADQWLNLRLLKNVSPDPARFPGWDEALRTAMQRETEMYFEGIMREDRSILEFLDSKYTYLNERLAKHYGISGVSGDYLRRVELSDNRRGGILTQASILTLTSNPTRTSPVKRGKWVLEQIFNTPPPPPPPNVPLLKDDNQNVMLTGTLRQRMEQHRKDPACANCHAKLDPLGFGLESFDAVGAWRDKDGDQPVDASGVLPDGRKFDGPAGLKKILLGQKDAFARALSQQLLTYALGRGLEPSDQCYVKTISEGVAKKGYRFSSLVAGIVHSDPFRLRTLHKEKPRPAPKRQARGK
jgi:mono/diheme cytochrome c family protein